MDDRGSIGNYDAQPLVYFNTDVAHVGPEFNLPGDINIPNDLPTLKGAINSLLGRVGNIQQGFVAQNANQYAPAGTHLRPDFRMPEYDFYAQDTWKILPNVVLDLGLRWEIKLSPRTSSNFLLRPNQAILGRLRDQRYDCLGSGSSIQRLLAQPGAIGRRRLGSHRRRQNLRAR